MPEEGIPVDPEAAKRRYGPGHTDHLRQQAASVGINMITGRTLIPNPRKAQEASLFAREHGKFETFHKALFKAYFEEGRNIGDVDVLAEIAQSCDLDGDALRQAISDRRYSDELAEQIEWARQIGVTAIPTFVFGDKLAVVGAHEYPVFEEAMRRLNVSPRETLPSEGQDS